MLTSNKTCCLHSDIIVKSIKCNELISLLKSHNDLSYLTTPHFCSSAPIYIFKIYSI